MLVFNIYVHASREVRHPFTNYFVGSLRYIKQLNKLKNKTKPNKSNNPKYQSANIN